MPKGERTFPKSISVTHPDFPLLSSIRHAIFESAGGESQLAKALPDLLQDAIDFVIDPVRTARNRISELDNVEKTFVGLKVEHFLRDFLNVPKGIRDLLINGHDVDVKNTVGRTWMIPPETYRGEDPCLLIAIADTEKRFWLGLIAARDKYLGKGNRDEKRSVSMEGMRNILWIVEGKKLPLSRWQDIDIARFREVRRIKGGSKRAAQFFRENLNRPVHRLIIQSLLFDQLDYMKRIRGNGGARDILRPEGISLLSGMYDRAKLETSGFGNIGTQSFIALKLPEPE